MKHTEPHGLTTRLLTLLLPKRDKEALLGDLAEEHALLASSLPPRDAARWFRNQLLRSVGISCRAWLKTLGAALIAYLVAALMVIASDLVMMKLLPANNRIYSLISLATGFATMLAGGYLAAWMRPRASLTLAVFWGLMGVVSVTVTGERAPMWYQLSLIVVGSAAAWTGGRIRIGRI